MAEEEITKELSRPPVASQRAGYHERIIDMDQVADEQFIPQFAVEEFNISVLPRILWLDKHRRDSEPLVPTLQPDAKMIHDLGPYALTHSANAGLEKPPSHYGIFGDLGFERRRDCQSNAQIMRNASPALAINSNTAIFASTGELHSHEVVGRGYHSTQGEPDWELP